MKNQPLTIMKKKRDILAVAAIIVLFMNACTQRNGGSSGKTAERAAVDSDTISYLEAKKYVANYGPRAGIVKRVSNVDNKVNVDTLPDTRCIWFSIDRLKALVDQIKKEKGDGIRFYLSTYDKVYVGEKHPHQPPKDYWGYNTLIMVSTQYLDGNHVDYYGNSISANPRGPGFIVLADPENRGELCPPPANCKSIGATLLDE